MTLDYCMQRISVGIWFEFNFYMHKMSFDCRLLQANESLRELSVVQGMSAEQLYKEHAPQLLDSFGESYVHWTNHSVERLIFDTLLIYSGERTIVNSIHRGYVLIFMLSIFGCSSKPADFHLSEPPAVF